MKVFVILWAASLIAGDKLDRTYLPPSGSITAGGQPGDLDLPLEYPKGSYPSTLAPGIERNGSDLRIKYPNVAIGIANQGPRTTAESYSTRSGDPSSKNVFSVPMTISPYTFTPTTRLPQFASYGTTIGSVNPQRHPSTISVIEPTSNYPSFVQQQIIPSGTSQKFIPAQNNNVAQTYTKYTNGTVQKNIENELVNEPGTFPTKSPSFVQSISPEFIQPSVYNRGDPDAVSGVTSSSVTTAYPDYYDKQGSVTYKPYDNQFLSEKGQYSFPQTSKNFVNENLNSKDFSGSLSTSDPQPYSVSSTPGTDALSSDDSAGSMYSFKNNVEINRPERIQAEADRNAVIINYENLLTPEGFAYSYDTSNGIHADESGTATNGVKAEGSYSYIGDDGEIYRIVYTADERGFIPLGDHLPTAPPVPKAILKVIEEAENNRRLGIIDDGSYDDSKYGHGRYQGVVDRMPQEQYENFERKQQDIKDESLRDKTISNEREGLPGEAAVSSRRPYNDNGLDGIIYRGNNTYTTGENYQLVPNANQYNNDNIRNPQAAQGINNQVIYEPQGKLTGTAIIRGPSGTRQNPEKVLNFPSKTDSIKENLNLPSYDGYKYDRPQNKFNQNRIQSPAIFNEEGVEILPGNIKNEDALPPSVKTYIASENFDRENNQYSNMRPLTNDYNRPVTVTRKPSSDYGDFDNNRVTNTIFNTRKPSSGSLASGPYDFASSTTPAPGTIQQEYYSSTSGPQYPSTTSFPSRYSTSTINGVRFSPTSPSTFASSTLRPISSTTLVSTSRRPSYSVSTSKPYTAFGSSTRRPVSSDSRIDERTRLRGSTNAPGSSDRGNESVQQDPSNYSQKDQTRLGVVDRERIPSRPSFGGQSSTERVVTEDFSGPKQTQRYDPKYGYYY